MADVHVDLLALRTAVESLVQRLRDVELPKIQSSENFFQDGVLDSMDVMHLISAMEDHFAAEVPEHLLRAESFSSLNALVSLALAMQEGKHSER